MTTKIKNCISLEENFSISENSDLENFTNEQKSLAVDKVLRILHQTKTHLEITLASKELIKNLSWAIQKIETNSLYMSSLEEIEENEDVDNNEKTEFLENFQDFSFVNNIYKFNRERVISKTAHNADLNHLKLMRDNLKMRKLEKIDHQFEEEDEEMENFSLKKKSGLVLKEKKSDLFANGKVECLFGNDVLLINEGVEERKYMTITDEDVINYEIKDENSNINDCNILSQKVKIYETNYNMNNIVSKYFNIFNFEAIFGREKSFVLIGKELFRSMDLMNIIDNTKLDSFLCELRNNYISSNEYHNERHGADVGQTTSTILKESEVIEISFLQDIDILSIIVSAIGHDVGHPGMNNNFQINFRTEVAMTYHDKSVLENYHIYLLFKIIRKPEFNIINSFSKEDYSIFRKRVIEAIIATDMFYHGKVVSSLKNKLFNYKESKKLNENEMLINPENKTFFDDQQEIINIIIHAADISHNTKPFQISSKWTEFLTNEFHSQGDKERSLELPISFLCDRTTSNVPKSQIGFINFVIIPTFDVLAEAFSSLSYLVNNSKINLQKWEEKLKEIEKVE